MKNCFGEIPLWECHNILSDVAMGRKPADLIIRNATLVNVCTCETIENTDVAISCGRIALVGDGSHIKSSKIIDAKGRYIAPGFMDGHMHIESSMVTVAEYARAVIPHGTTTIFTDPHEICNVLGMDGVRYMIEDSHSSPLKTRITAPSCVPSVPGFEDTNGSIAPEDVSEMMKWDEVAGLGEMMNFPGIISSNEKVQKIVAETLIAGKTPTGHYSVPETGKGLNAYIASGINCCHESSRAEDALAKMRLGMYAMLREGSAWRDLHEVGKAARDMAQDTRFAVLVSDDNHPETLSKHGHVDHLVRRAIEEGINPLQAIQMVTINCAQCYNLAHDTGSVTPGKCADLVIFDSLEKIDVSMTIINGEIVYQNKTLLCDIKPYIYPDCALNSIHIKNKITADSFRIPYEKKQAKVNVIEIIPAKTPTVATTATLKVINGNIAADPEGQDILKVAVINRHNEHNKMSFAFVKGFNIKKGAVASTVNHDAHNLMVMGTNESDMAIAANALINSHGGHVAVNDGKIMAIVELPVAGLMSPQPVSVMKDKIYNLKHAWIDLGCNRTAPFMTMSILSLACIPELRITNRGLVDCKSFEIIPLIIE